jgi:hypothetical protein
MKKQISLWALLLLTAVVYAQDSPEPGEVAEIPRYTVEIIIFSYDQEVSAGTEMFVPDEPPPVEAPDEANLENNDTLESTPEFVPEPEVIAEDTTKKFELTMLAEDDFTMQNIVDHLERLDAYRPLVHFGWTQSTYPEEETEARPLSFFVTPPTGLDGDLKLYLSRYLHLALNLQLDAPVAETTGNRDNSFGYNDSQVVSYPVRYRIVEDRIFKNGDLRYFDHPKFGVLAKITRAADAVDSEVDPYNETELLGDGE